MFVEGELFVVGDHDDAEVILVYFMDLVDEDFADAFALVFGAHEQVMHIGVHDAVVHRANHADKFIAVPGRDDGLVAKKSGGQKKRISIGMELIADPELFILDEPDSGLDGVIARELFERLRDVANQGKIVIAITHTPDRVVDLFDKVIVLARDSGRVGRLAFYGTPDEAKEFFEKDSMERIVMCVNSTHEGGEGRADEFIEKFAHLKQEGGASHG